FFIIHHFLSFFKKKISCLYYLESWWLLRWCKWNICSFIWSIKTFSVVSYKTFHLYFLNNKIKYFLMVFFQRGICQTPCLCCWTFRRQFKKKLGNRYISRAGIPLAEDPRNMPPGATI